MSAQRVEFDLPPVMLEQVVAHAQAGYPEEVCGLVSGRDGKPAGVHPGRNVSPTPRSAYEMDAETLALQIEFEESGLDLLAIYHSHPAGPEEPSPTDIARCMYPEAIYLIVSLADRMRPVFGAFRIQPAHP